MFVIGDNQVDIHMQYDESIASKEEMGWIMSHLSTAVSSLNSQDEETKVKFVQIGGAKDYQQIQKWNSTYPEVYDLCVHDLIKAQVERTPNAPAIHAWDGDMTYKELDTFSDGLAYHLRALGVGPEVVVAMCFDKSMYVSASVVAVLKAGGAFLNLNPTQHINRLTDQIADTGSFLILTEPKYASMFTGFSQTVVQVTAESALGRPINHVLSKTAQPGNKAYLISTSGSTGKPKFVIIEHRAISSSVMAQGKALFYTPHARIIQLAAHTFDVFIAEVLGTFTHGGCLCVPSEFQKMNNLSGAINSLKVNYAKMTNTTLSLIKPDSVPTLKTVVLGGEPLTDEVRDTWSKRIHLINGYGPSECSVYSCANPHFQAEWKSPNIGKAFGCRQWITESDDPTKLAAIGSVGEVVIEGPILLREYLNEPEKTAITSIEAPSWLKKLGGAQQGNKVYRTGDLMRYNLDGSFFYICRRDTQMKINGLRIEAGEIEVRIRGLRPDWVDVIVEVVKQKAWNDRPALVVFFTRKDDNPPAFEDGSTLRRLTPAVQDSCAELQALLPENLPAYMVPSLYIPMESLPLTVNFKTDRKSMKTLLDVATRDQLKHYALSDNGDTDGRRPPITVLQKQLADLWAEVLHIPVEIIGLDDNFFKMGGDSVQAMKLVSEAAESDLILTVASIFHYPRLEEAAQNLKSDDIHSSIASVVPFSQLSVPNVDRFLQRVVCPKLHARKEAIVNVMEATDIQSLSLASSLTESRAMLNYFYWEGTGKLDMTTLSTAFDIWVNSVEAFRTVFMLHDNKFWAVVLNHINPRTTYLETNEDLAAVHKREYQENLLQEPLPIEEPAMEFRVLQQKNGLKHRIIFRISHAQYDGYSWRNLMKSFMDAYAGRQYNEINPYSSFATQAHLQQNEETFGYWRTFLEGSTMLPIVQSQSTSKRETVRSIRQIKVPASALDGVGFATIVKAAWGFVLSQIHGTSDVTFGNTISGRSNGGTDVIGPCMNIIPVRVNLQNISTIEELLLQVDSQPYANMPYETLGMRQIIKHCTNWSPLGPNRDSFYSSIVQHEDIEDKKDRVRIGEIDYTHGYMAPEQQTLDAIGIYSYPKDDRIEIALIWSPDVMSLNFATKLIELLCSTCKIFASQPQEPLPKPFYKYAITPIRYAGKRIGTSTDSRAVILEEIDEHKNYALHILLEGLWKGLLTSNKAVSSDQSLSSTSSFFALGGDMIQFAQLKLLLAEKGFMVTVEDLMANPTLESQIGLLANYDRTAAPYTGWG